MRAWPWIVGTLVGLAITIASRPVWARTTEGQKIERDLAPFFAEAEKKHRLPTGLLSRVAFQESRFREDIISGRVKSSAGAQGLMQFMPATAAELGVKLDDGSVVDDIHGAAKYLADQFKRFGSWAHAVMAYNWGPHNVAAWLKTGRGARGQTMPQETYDYYTSISRDLNLT